MCVCVCTCNALAHTFLLAIPPMPESIESTIQQPQTCDAFHYTLEFSEPHSIKYVQLCPCRPSFRREYFKPIS